MAGLTPLLAACDTDDVQAGTARHLVLVLGANVRATDSSGATAADLAAQHEDLVLAEWLRARMVAAVCTCCLLDIAGRILRCPHCRLAPFCSETCRDQGAAIHALTCTAPESQRATGAPDAVQAAV